MSEMVDEARKSRDMGSKATKSGCIHAHGPHDADGYVKIWRNGRSWRAHRLAWIDAHGPISAGLQVMHSCDNPQCINLEHLSLGTLQDNMADKVSKGRQAKGVNNGRARATENDVLEIQRRLIAGDSMYRIGLDMGFDSGTIRAIRDGQTWTHVTGGPIVECRSRSLCKNGHQHKGRENALGRLSAKHESPVAGGQSLKHCVSRDLKPETYRLLSEQEAELVLRKGKPHG